MENEVKRRFQQERDIKRVLCFDIRGPQRVSRRRTEDERNGSHELAYPFYEVWAVFMTLPTSYPCCFTRSMIWL